MNIGELIRDKHFNPRTREGCDISLKFSFLIHKYFNPRTREGCDFTRIGEKIVLI